MHPLLELLSTTCIKCESAEEAEAVIKALPQDLVGPETSRRPAYWWTQGYTHLATYRSLGCVALHAVQPPSHNRIKAKDFLEALNK